MTEGHSVVMAPILPLSLLSVLTGQLEERSKSWRKSHDRVASCGLILLPAAQLVLYKGSRKERGELEYGEKEKRTLEISGGAGDTVQQVRVLLSHATQVLLLAPMSCSTELLVTPVPGGLKSTGSKSTSIHLHTHS